MVDIDIVTLATAESFDSNALESVLSSALDTVVSDGTVGDYGVDVAGAVHVGTPTLGTY